MKFVGRAGPETLAEKVIYLLFGIGLFFGLPIGAAGLMDYFNVPGWFIDLFVCLYVFGIIILVFTYTMGGFHSGARS